jgi:hypothetical protein
MNALFTHGGKITPEATKDRGSHRSTKPARDLLLDLHHPYILLSQISSERHNELMLVMLPGLFGLPVLPQKLA